MNITHFEPGKSFRLVDFGKTDAQYRRRLLALGLMKGTEIRVVRTAPLGCPVQIEAMGSALALRVEEAIHLIWEPL